jgi:hypothetical protein
MSKIIQIVLLIFLISITSLKARIFKESNIISETQVFSNTNNIVLDSISIHAYSDGIDSLRISIYKDKNSFNQYLDSIPVFQTIYTISEKGASQIVLNLMDKDLEFNKENIYVKFESLNSNSRLQTSTKFNSKICDYELFNRYQFYNDVSGNQVYGESNYMVDVFTRSINYSDLFDYQQQIDLIDTTNKYSTNTNIILVDINEDELLDMIISTDLYMNQGEGKFILKKKLFDSASGLNIICDLDNDKNLEVINLNLEGTLTVLTINNEAEIINITTFQLEEFDNNYEELLLNDYDKDGFVDIIVKYKEHLNVLINEFPSYTEKRINLGTGTNYLDYWNDKLVVNNSNSIEKEDSELIFRDSDYMFLNYKNNDSIRFENNSSFADDVFTFGNIENKVSINRRIFSPKEFYNITLDNEDKFYSIVISDCSCEFNYIYKTDASNLNDISEETSLKQINLKNSIFADITGDGFKEIIAIIDNKIEIYENTSKLKKLNKNKTINTNYIKYTNYDNDESILIPSFRKFGNNQVFGSFSINDFNMDDESLISLNDNYFNISNGQFTMDSENVNFRDEKLNFSPNPFNDRTTLFSENRRIKKIKIFNNNGVEVFKIKPNTFEYIWNGKSSSMNTLAQGVYFYEIYLEGSKSPITGQIIKVTEK